MKSRKVGKRVTIDLTEAAAAEVDRLTLRTGLTTAGLFRHALTLMRIYVASEAKGAQFKIVSPSGESDLVVLPISVARRTT